MLRKKYKPSAQRVGGAHGIVVTFDEHRPLLHACRLLDTGERVAKGIPLRPVYGFKRGPKVWAFFAAEQRAREHQLACIAAQP